MKILQGDWDFEEKPNRNIRNEQYNIKKWKMQFKAPTAGKAEGKISKKKDKMLQTVW